jgi:hypothetical protein
MLPFALRHLSVLASLTSRPSATHFLPRNFLPPSSLRPAEKKDTYEAGRMTTRPATRGCGPHAHRQRQTRREKSGGRRRRDSETHRRPGSGKAGGDGRHSSHSLPARLSTDLDSPPPPPILCTALRRSHCLTAGSLRRDFLPAFRPCHVNVSIVRCVCRHEHSTLPHLRPAPLRVRCGPQAASPARDLGFCGPQVTRYHLILQVSGFFKAPLRDGHHGKSIFRVARAFAACQVFSFLDAAFRDHNKKRDSPISRRAISPCHVGGSAVTDAFCLVSSHTPSQPIHAPRTRTTRTGEVGKTANRFP